LTNCVEWEGEKGNQGHNRELIHQGTFFDLPDYQQYGQDCASNAAPSAAPGIRSAAEAEGRRLQAVVRQLGRAYCRAGS
jgi:hypothetical protein